MKMNRNDKTHSLTPVEEAIRYFDPYPHPVLRMMAEDYESRQRKKQKKNRFDEYSYMEKSPEPEKRSNVKNETDSNNPSILSRVNDALWNFLEMVGSYNLEEKATEEVNEIGTNVGKTAYNLAYSPARWLLIDAIMPWADPINKRRMYTFTNKDLSQDAINYAANVADSIAKVRYPRTYNKMLRDSIPIQISVEGNSYNQNYGGTVGRSFAQKMFTSQGQVENTLGSYNAEISPSGILITDSPRYDFSACNLADPTSGYGLVRNLATWTNTPDYEPKYQKIPVVITAPRNNENYEQNKQVLDARAKEKYEEIDRENKKSYEESKTEAAIKQREKDKQLYNIKRLIQLGRIIDSFVQ